MGVHDATLLGWRLAGLCCACGPASATVGLGLAWHAWRALSCLALSSWDGEEEEKDAMVRLCRQAGRATAVGRTQEGTNEARQLDGLRTSWCDVFMHEPHGA